MALAASTTAGRADAQVSAGGTWTTGAAPGWTTAQAPGYPAQPGYPPPGYPVQPGYGAPMGYAPRYQKATDLELGTLYAFSVAYGVGTGVWIDAEANIDDPGLQFIAPAVLGVAAPVGVFFLNQPTMPRGMPAAIATGMALGAGEGLGIATYQLATASDHDRWHFRGVARSIFIGSTIGTVAGAVSGYYMEPSPRQSLLLGSSILWGSLIGSAFGYGGSNGDWENSRGSMGLGGLIGYNAALVGAAAVSAVWVPSYESLAWMWGGFAAGVAVSLPVYLFYVGGDHDARRGLIFQGTAGTLGLVAGAVFTANSRDFGSAARKRVAAAEAESKSNAPIQITGGGFFPVRDGVGLQVQGVIF